MQKYKQLHRYMILPMVVMQLGIAYDYWGDFTDNAWSVHIHYWTGTIWYFYLIIQPYYATHRQLARHRTNGIIGMFLAGGVAFTALSMMYRDIQTAQISIDNPERFGPFKAWFFYGILVVEVIMICSFMFAVIKSIIYRKDLENHAWWMISTVFIIMMPALARGLQYVQISIYGFALDMDVMIGIYMANFVIIGLVIITANKYNHLKHPATYLAIAVNLFNCLIEPIGQTSAIQNLLEVSIKG